MRAFVQDLVDHEVSFRPRADRAQLQKFVEEACAAVVGPVNEESCAEMAEAIADFIDSLLPCASDLEVLKRFYVGRLEDYVSVSFPREDGYFQSAEFNLPRKVYVIPRVNDSIHAGGLRYSTHPTAGIKDTVWAGYSEDEKKEAIEYHRGHEAQQLPDYVNSFFDGVRAVRTVCKEARNQACEVPEKLKRELGRHPTWKEVIEAIPLAAKFLAGQPYPDALAAMEDK